MDMLGIRRNKFVIERHLDRHHPILLDKMFVMFYVYDYPLSIIEQLFLCLPVDLHWTDVKQIHRHLKKTLTYGYSSSQIFICELFHDVDLLTGIL